jgi:signal transduction histidine kinase
MPIRVLLIDDSPVDTELARRGLRSLPDRYQPVEIVAASRLEDALPHLRGGTFDVILLDFNLPGQTGLEILRSLQKSSSPPVVMMTGQQDVAIAIETLRAGAYDYVPKAANWAPVLGTTIERVLTRVALERELAESRRRLEVYATELQRKVETRTALVRSQAAEIERLYLQSQEAARLKAEIISNLSHEMRTPLNVMMGYMELLEETLQQQLPGALESLAKVQSQTGHLHRVIESLLALGRLAAGAEGVIRTQFSTGRIAADLQRDALALNEKGLTVGWHVEPVDVEHDREKVRMIAYHLLSNALKFTHVGRVDVTIARTPAAGIRLVVSDTGIGLPAEARALVFEDFRQLDGSNTRRFEGLGLGLGIVKRYTHLLGGTVEVDSPGGNGTRFVVVLPPLSAAESAQPSADTVP